MKKVYDVLLQCGICQRELDHFLTLDEVKLGQETSRGVCHKCAGEYDDAGKITLVDVVDVIDDDEEFKAWCDELQHVDTSEVEHIFPWTDVFVVSVTAWSVPINQYPDREWLTVREAADRMKMNKDTLWTKIKRGEFHSFQTRGYIQAASSSVTLIHRSVVEEYLA